MRVETPGSYAENNNNALVLLPHTVDPITGITGTAGLVASSLYGPRYTLAEVAPQWGPRLGFAYRLTNNTVFRGGYSLSYLPRDNQTGEFGVNQPINSAATSNSNVGLATPAYSMGTNPFPVTSQYPLGVQLAPGRSNPNFMVANIGQSVSVPDPHEQAPYTQEMNISTGHEFRGGTLSTSALRIRLALICRASPRGWISCRTSTIQWERPLPSRTSGRRTDLPMTALLWRVRCRPTDRACGLSGIQELTPTAADYHGTSRTTRWR